MDCSETPVTETILANVAGCARDAMAVLARSGVPLASSAERVAAVDDFVERWQRGDRPPADAMDPQDVPYLMGSLWGEAIVAALGWSWVQVVFNQRTDTVATAVVSPDRSMAIFPIHFVLECVQEAAVDCTIALSFDMLVAGQAGDLTPHGYANVMDVVHRIVPRR